MPQLKFLFSLIDGGGNTVPVLQAAGKLRKKHHSVWILSNPCLEKRVEAVGATFLPFRRAPLHDPSSPETDYVKAWEGTQASEIADRIRDRLMFGPSKAIAEDVLEVIRMVEPDAAINDYVLFGGMIASEAAAVPTAVIVPHVYPLPHAGARNRGAFTYMFHRLISRATPSLNEVRRNLGLSDLGNVVEQYSHADRMLLCTYRIFDAPGDDLPHNVTYIGPQLDLPSDDALVTRGARQPPLVVVSFSTAYLQQEEVLKRVVDALAGLPVRAVVLLGPALARQNIMAAENVAVHNFIPHSQLLPDASLVITHAGHGTAIGALGHGVPLLCLPFAQDQFDISKRVVQLGAGLELQRNSSSEAIRAAVLEVLNHSSYRSAAQLARKSFMKEDDPSLVVQELENLATCKSARHAQLVQ